jgi:hypothetical protein
MGNYINVGNAAFTISRNGEYVDKSELISVVNSTINTERMFSCVTRSRRFGKSMAAKMLCAYYDQSCDSHHLFDDLLIASNPDYKKHLNKYPVIYLDISDFVTEIKEKTIVRQMQQIIKEDIHKEYADVPINNDESLMVYLTRVADVTGQKFIFIIDEWDGILREFEGDHEVIDTYVDWLRRLFKSGQTAKVFAGVYLTGILPIKKYNTQSALNNFTEYTMLAPKDMASYFGFTKEEVQALADKHGMDYGELEKWYDGYQIGSASSMFNPNSVMMALKEQFCQSFWSSTGAFMAVADYIKMNFKGLKDDVIDLLAGGRIKVDTIKFQNDMSVIGGRDDVLTVLIHLGYLTFDRTCNECYVPNYEVAGELRGAVETTDWDIVIDAIQQSDRLLVHTLRGNAEAVARCIDAVHNDQTSILAYNDENSLSCVISLAYYSARNEYIIHRELPTGYGYADLVFIPRKNVNKPALIVELKCGKSAEEAIDQIKERKYVEKVRQHTSDVLLVGINYDADSKKHTCIIEKAE